MTALLRGVSIRIMLALNPENLKKNNANALSLTVIIRRYVTTRNVLRLLRL